MQHMISDNDFGINDNAAPQLPDNGNTPQFNQLINNTNFGFWEFNTQTREVNWSKGFYQQLGYEPGEIECSYDFLADELLYHEDKKIFQNQHSSTIQVRILTKKNGYRWFELTTGKYNNGPDYLLYGLLKDIHQHKLTALKLTNEQSSLTETARIAKIGGWYLDTVITNISLSAEAIAIFDLHNELPLSLQEFAAYFQPDHRQILTNAIDNAIRQFQPFDLELLFKSSKNKKSWLRCKAAPIIDNYGHCIGLRGILQVLDKKQDKIPSIPNSLHFLEDQNQRLQNFAYMVSHNLRSYTATLSSIIELYEKADKPTERNEIFNHIKSLSNSLTNTIGQLTDVVRIQLETNKEKQTIQFETVFKNAVAASQYNIINTNATVNHDFSQCPQINYIPAYLESIFENLLTNALKYFHPERSPVIDCYTYRENNHIFLVFKDNGIGIDLERFGDKVFGMYETFHQNADAKGIGLFITRNQVESLGGSIKLESMVNIGTTFTIKLT